MRQATIKYNNIQAGILKELDSGEYEFVYDDRMGLLLACCQNTIGAVSVHTQRANLC